MQRAASKAGLSFLLKTNAIGWFTCVGRGLRYGQASFSGAMFDCELLSQVQAVGSDESETTKFYDAGKVLKKNTEKSPTNGVAKGSRYPV